MATFAVISGNSVSNVITADNKETAEQELGLTLVEITLQNPAGIGWVLDEFGVFRFPVNEEQSE